MLVTEARNEGFGFVGRFRDRWMSAENRFDRLGERLLGVWEDGQLVAFCGLNIDPYHSDPKVGRLRHLYVSARLRRHGVGAGLLYAILRPSPPFDRLRLRSDSPASARFYLRHGWTPCDEANATHQLHLPT